MVNINYPIIIKAIIGIKLVKGGKGFIMYPLKESIKIDEERVECPVAGCNEFVKRQRDHFKRAKEFKCPKHDIFISPSTFEYKNELNNLLWHDDEDVELLKGIKTVKRESRMARERSEDAVSWNALRFLEKNELTGSVFNRLLGVSLSSPEIIYWSYSKNSKKENSSWPPLNDARQEFDEQLNRSSEPDIIIRSDSALLFIEAKLTARNETSPSNPKEFKKYTSGGNCWFSEVFKSDYSDVAIKARKYELMRFWLLGTWMAKQLGLDFYLVNLVRAGSEEDIEKAFGEYIAQDERRKFKRITWEDVYKAIRDTALSNSVTDLMLDYFRNKTLGYDTHGKLQKAFDL
jgi:hypothetical protein